MSARRIGKAKIDMETELWMVEGKSDRFHNNRRLVDTHPDVKKIRSQYLHTVKAKRPTRKQFDKREEYFQKRDDTKKEYLDCLRRVYEEIRLESFTDPIPLWKEKDYAHKIDWRYCLYAGEIYQFNQTGLSPEIMKEQIEETQKRSQVSP